MAVVHIAIGDRALCGFTSDPVEHWPREHQAVHPEEAHYCSCHKCISLLHDSDEREVYS